MVVVYGTAQWLSRCLLAMRQYENRRAKSNHTVIARSEATRQSVLFYRAGGLGTVKLDADSHDQCEHWSRNDRGFYTLQCLLSNSSILGRFTPSVACATPPSSEGAKAES